ncbi:BPSL0761 family protein [Paraburkholderia sp. J41]|uniref:BPSL0761 family protein n=1 Tax=Paraburkholderia sp. J41 TaxID=2805433 RepID=UPI002AC33FC8|nr:BPSL0761 family protein [Paraburkholderia sp. J41]
MTFPTERTQAILETRDFLQLLADAESIEVAGLVQSVALALLRHLPVRDDLEASALILPEIWAAPSDIDRIRRRSAPADVMMFAR